MRKIGMARLKLPTVNEIGRELERTGLVRFHNRRYTQTGEDCFQIAQVLGRRFGYVMPQTPSVAIGKLVKVRTQERRHRRLGEMLPPETIRSCANLVIRQGDNASDVHFALEVYGVEYNFGVTSKDGFNVQLRIPLVAGKQ